MQWHTVRTEVTGQLATTPMSALEPFVDHHECQLYLEDKSVRRVSITSSDGRFIG